MAANHNLKSDSTAVEDMSEMGQCSSTDIATVASTTRDERSENHFESSFKLPSESLGTYDKIFALGGQEFLLNNCGTKRLVIGITSPVMPKLKVIFRLYDLKNQCYIEFNKKSWNTIIQHENEFLNNLHNNIVGFVFDNNHISAQTELLYDRCCVQFYDVAETHVALANSSFERMISLKHEIERIYLELTKKITDVSKRMKLFMDLTFFQLLKSNNIDVRHNYNWLLLYMNNKSTNFMELNNSIANTWEQLGMWISNDEESRAAENS